MKADNDHWTNDPVWVQFSIYFANSGAQTLRLQNREDGIAIDQIVLSAVRYATTAPGANKNDTTILPRTPK